MDAPEQPVFYYDLGSPQCYLVAETIMAGLPVVPEWEPVLGRNFDRPTVNREDIELQATVLNLQPIRWPTAWPGDTERAMLAATYAKRIGRAVAFSLAAFRQTFAGGRDLTDENTILIAGAACEMHPTALRKGIELASVHTHRVANRHPPRTGLRRHHPARDPGRRYRLLRPGGDPQRNNVLRAMKANRAYDLIVSRGGREPAFMSDPSRTDRIEVVSVDDGEVILYWNLAPKEASKLIRLLRADLVNLEAEEFFDKWLDADAEDF